MNDIIPPELKKEDDFWPRLRSWVRMRLFSQSRMILQVPTFNIHYVPDVGGFAKASFIFAQVIQDPEVSSTKLVSVEHAIETLQKANNLLTGDVPQDFIDIINNVIEFTERQLPDKKELVSCQIKISSQYVNKHPHEMFSFVLEKPHFNNTDKVLKMQLDFHSCTCQEPKETDNDYYGKR